MRPGRAAPEPKRAHPPIREEDIPRSVRGGERHRAVAAELAAKKITPARSTICAACRRRSSAISPTRSAAYFTVNQEIHRAIVAAAESRRCADARMAVAAAERAAIWPSLAATLGRVRRRAPRRPRCPGAQDADAAGRLLARHVLHTGSEVIEVLRLSAAA